MSVHQALRELKLLDSRIKSAVNKKFCTYVQGNKEEVFGKKLKDFEEEVKANYQSVTDLIKRRSKIKSAIIMSNATTEVKIGDERMTVAEAIDRKASIQYDKYFLNQLKEQYTSVTKSIELKNGDLDYRLNDYLRSALGETSKGDINVIESLTKTFIDNNTHKIVDPIKIVTKIEELEKKIEDFESSVDTVLSESNALNFIEI